MGPPEKDIWIRAWNVKVNIAGKAPSQVYLFLDSFTILCAHRRWSIRIDKPD